MSTPPYRPVDQLAREWESAGRGAESRRALRLLGQHEVSIAEMLPDESSDLSDLVHALRMPRGRAEREASAEVVRALLRSSALHPLVPRALLQTLLPGLVNVAKRLSWGQGGDWDGGGAFFSDLVATAWEVITDWSGQDRPYAVLDLLSAIRCRCRRQLESHKAIRSRVCLVGTWPVCAGGMS